VLGLGLSLGAAGGAGLLLTVCRADDPGPDVVAVGLYAVALPTMFLCALLFGAARDPVQRGFLRRLDHAAIFALIAATSTPFAVAEPIGRGLGFAAAIWAAAAVGIFFKLRYPIGRARCSAAIFGLSGWSVMLLLAPSIASRRALFLLLLGGALYTIGTGVFLWRRLRFRRALWHVFVIAGAGAHYLAVSAILG
jgi:hemolysin III